MLWQMKACAPAVANETVQGCLHSAEMPLPMWQHLISDTAGRNCWDPLNTARGWHLVICRESKQGPSWLSSLRCVSTVPKALPLCEAHMQICRCGNGHSESDCITGAHELSLASSCIRLLACSQHFGFRRPNAFSET